MPKWSPMTGFLTKSKDPWRGWDTGDVVFFVFLVIVFLPAAFIFALYRMHTIKERTDDETQERLARLEHEHKNKT